MRVALITEGTYPVVTGGVSTWCDQLVAGMAEHDFHVIALTGGRVDKLAWEVPSNVRTVRLIPVWGPPVSPLRPGNRRRAWVDYTQHALTQLWDAVLGPETGGPGSGGLAIGGLASDDAAGRMANALQRLVGISDSVGLARSLATRGSVAPILGAWSRYARVSGEPAMSVADAVLVAGIVDRALAVIDHRPTPVDVIHASSNGPSTLLALAQSWRDGTPLLLTEHGVYLRERYLALHSAKMPWPVRRAVTAFLRQLCHVVHRHAHMVLPVNQFNARWEKKLGADPARIHTIPNGVDPARFEPVLEEPELPTISFVGRIDPLKDIGTLIAAFALVRERLPDAQLRLFGPMPAENAWYGASLVEQVDALGIADAVHWEGPSKGSRPAIAAGHVVALSSISEGLPFTLIEAMMCGRATVNTDVGGVSECLDEEQTTGMLVAARDHVAFAEACITLLTDHQLRAAMGAAARRRALIEFTLERCLARYREAYDAARDGRLLELPPARSTDVTGVAPLSRTDQPGMDQTAIVRAAADQATLKVSA